MACFSCPGFRRSVASQAPSTAPAMVATALTASKAGLIRATWTWARKPLSEAKIKNRLRGPLGSLWCGAIG